MRALVYERRGPAAASVVLLGAIALMAMLVVEGRGLHKLVPVVACIVVLGTWTGLLTKWRNLLSGLVIVILFIPIGRYSLPGNLPFQLEPYRVVVMGLAVAWVMSMLVDPRVRFRRSGMDAPLMLILVTTLLSDVVNPSRVRALSSDVVPRAQMFFVSFFIVLYLIVSLVRTRKDVLFFVRLLAGGGGTVAAFGLIERRTNYNVFDHLHTVFPLLSFAGADERFRSGRLRVLASSQHPIALSVLLVVLLPFVIYLARREDRRWLGVGVLYIVAIFATASRTGIVGLLVLLIVYLVFQPRAVLRAWPLVVPLLAVVHVAAPGAIGTIREALQPSGLIKEQTTVVAGNDAYASGRFTDFAPTIKQWSSSPLLGVGFGTRVISGPNANARILDDQWLGTLLETGYFGFLAWSWLFLHCVRRLARAAAKEGDTDDGWLLTGLLGAITAFATTMWLYDTLSFVQNVLMCFILLGLSAAYLKIRAREDLANGRDIRAS
jgi:O-antigen ligase